MIAPLARIACEVAKESGPSLLRRCGELAALIATEEGVRTSFRWVNSKLGSAPQSRRAVRKRRRRSA